MVLNTISTGVNGNQMEDRGNLAWASTPGRQQLNRGRLDVAGQAFDGVKCDVRTIFDLRDGFHADTGQPRQLVLCHPQFKTRDPKILAEDPGQLARDLRRGCGDGLGDLLWVQLRDLDRAARLLSRLTVTHSRSVLNQ